MKIFKDILANYLISGIGLKKAEGDKLKEVITKTTFQELFDQYNMLSAQYLWDDFLIDIYYNELLNRLMDATFIITLVDYKGLIRIGYEDSYQIINSDGTNIYPMRYDVVYTSVTSFDLNDKDRKQLIRVILTRDVDIVTDGKEIFDIVESESNSYGIRVKAEVEEIGDYYYYNNMIREIRNNSPNIIKLIK